MNNFRRVLKNTASLTGAEILFKAIGFVWIIFLARALTVPQFGTYNFVNAFIGIFSFLPDLGVGLIVIRDIAKDPKNAPLYLGNSFILNGFLAVVTFFAALVTASFFRYPLETRFLILLSSFTLVLSTARSVGVFFFDGTERMVHSALLNSINSVLLIGGGLIGFLLTHTLSGIFLGMLFGTSGSVLITWSMTRSFITPKIAFNRKIVFHLFREGLPLGLAAFAALIYTEIDAVLLHNLLGDRAVGIYSAATPFSFALIQLLNVPFVIALYPTLTRLLHEDKARFKKAVFKSLGVIALWSIPLSLLISFLAPHVIPIFGQKYASATPILQVHILIVPFLSLSALLYKLLIIIRKQTVYLWISIMGAALNIILNFSFIPKYSIIGAAYASVITQGVLFIMYSLTVYLLLTKKQ